MREAIEYIVAAGLPRDECEIVPKPEFVSKKDLATTTRTINPKEPKKRRAAERKKLDDARAKRASTLAQVRELAAQKKIASIQRKDRRR
jgi:hypothetical protein